MARQNESSTPNRTETSRRAVLHGIAAVGAASGIAGASRGPSDISQEDRTLARQAAADYQSRETITEHVETAARPVIERLYRQDHIDTRDVDELVSEPTDGTDTDVYAFPEPSGPTVEVVIDVSDAVTIQVDPDAGEATSFLHRNEETEIIDTREVDADAVAPSDLTTQSCCAKYTSCVLSSDGNSFEAAECEIYCCGDRCTDCQYEIVGGCTVANARDPPACDLDAC